MAATPPRGVGGRREGCGRRTRSRRRVETPCWDPARDPANGARMCDEIKQVPEDRGVGQLTLRIIGSIAQ